MRRYPNSIMMSSQNDTTTSLLSNSERFHPSLRKSKSLPFMIPSTIRITPPQSNRTERGKSATLNSDHKSRLLFSRGPEGNIASLRDDGAIDTATHGLSINHNSAMSRSNSRISCARLVEGNPKNSSFSGTLNLSAKDYDGTIISHDIDHPIGRVITSRVNERTAKHSGPADENIRRRNSSGSSVSGILIPISVTDILSQSSDSKTGEMIK